MYLSGARPQHLRWSVWMWCASLFNPCAQWTPASVKAMANVQMRWRCWGQLKQYYLYCWRCWWHGGVWCGRAVWCPVRQPAGQTGSRAQDWAVVHYFYCGSQLQPLPLPSLPLDQTIFTAHQLATFPRLVCMILQDQTIFIARPSLPSLPSLTGVCLESA